MGWFFSNIAGGIIRWAIAAVVGAVCLMFGFSPEEWIRGVIEAPPSWLTHDLTRGGIVLVGVMVIGAVFFWDRAIRHRRLQAIGPDVQEQGDEKVFIRAPGSSGLRLIGNIFRGSRTHVDARGATNFEAVDNVHLEAGWREIRLSDALYWIIDNSDWGPGLGRDSFLDQAAIVLRQAARDEEITIRGRREVNRHGAGDRFDRTWENIEPSYWRTHEFEMTAVMCAEPHYATIETAVISPGDITAESMPHYAMLRVRNDELERRWPAANT